MQSDRFGSGIVSDIEHKRIFSPGIFFTIALVHMSAYICVITDLTFGVSG